MQRSLTLVMAGAIALGACGSASTESESTVPDETPSTEPAASDTAETSSTSGPVPASDPTNEPVPTTADDATTETQPDPASGTVPAETESTPDRLGRLAATDLADRLGLDVGDVEVVEVREVTWRDASLGCPQKDFQYAQVLTPGVRIVLSADGTTYVYHAGAERDPFYCVDPQAPV